MSITALSVLHQEYLKVCKSVGSNEVAVIYHHRSQVFKIKVLESKDVTTAVLRMIKLSEQKLFAEALESKFEDFYTLKSFQLNQFEKVVRLWCKMYTVHAPRKCDVATLLDRHTDLLKSLLSGKSDSFRFKMWNSTLDDDEGIVLDSCWIKEALVNHSMFQIRRLVEGDGSYHTTIRSIIAKVHNLMSSSRVEQYVIGRSPELQDILSHVSKFAEPVDALNFSKVLPPRSKQYELLQYNSEAYLKELSTLFLKENPKKLALELKNLLKNCFVQTLEMEKFKLEDWFVTLLLSYEPKIPYLDLGAKNLSSGFNLEGVVIPQSCRILSLRNNFSVTDDQLRRIVKGCPLIEKFNLSGCGQLLFKDVLFPKGCISLDISGCQVTSEYLLLAIKDCKNNLKRLDIRETGIQRESLVDVVPKNCEIFD